MNKSAILAMILAATLALPAYAGGGGGGGRGGRGGGGGGGGGGGFGGGGPGGGFGGGGFGGGGPGGGGAYGPTGGATGVYTTPGGAYTTTPPDRTTRTANPGGFTGTTRTTNTTAQRGTGLTGGPMRLPLDGDYQILGTTSIFAQNRRAIDPNVDIIGPTVVVDRTPPFRGDAPIFRGVVKDLSGNQAIVEVQEQDPLTRTVISNPHSLKAGQALSWDGGSYNVVSVDVEKREMQMTSPGQTEPATLQIGFNILGQAMQQLSDVASYRSADALGYTNTTTNQNQTNGRTARGRGGNTTYGTTGYGTTSGAATIGLTGGANMAGLQGALVSSVDPPLPPGSADNLEARMRARRDTQITAPSNVVTTPTGTGTVTPQGTILPAPAAGQ